MELSKYVWSLRENDKIPSIKWKIVKIVYVIAASSFSKLFHRKTFKCRRTWQVSQQFIKPEFINKYRHHNKLLKNVKDSKEKNLVWILERETDRHRQTDRQTDRQTGRQAERQTERQREADRQTDRETKNKKTYPRNTWNWVLHTCIATHCIAIPGLKRGEHSESHILLEYKSQNVNINNKLQKTNDK